MKNKKYLKILIVIVLFSILIIVFSEIVARPLSVVEKGPDALSGELFPNNNVKVSLIVREKKYEIEIKDGATVLEVMQKIQKENGKDDSFDFKYTEHTGLGIFINEINGLKGGSGGYWIYSVNGLEASIGVSNYKIKYGDIISWKYEK